jgi:hypothetical protein
LWKNGAQWSLVPFQLPLTPMRVLAVGIDDLRAVAVQGLEDADAGQPSPAAAGLCGLDQAFRSARKSHRGDARARETN